MKVLPEMFMKTNEVKIDLGRIPLYPVIFKKNKPLIVANP
jgi:hypothetical protein